MLDSTCHICIFKPNCSSETNRREFNKLCPLAQLLEHFVAEQHRESRIRSQAPSRHRTRMADEHVPYYRALISGNFRVLTLVSLQRLKMEALIPAPADVEMRSMIKFWMHRDQLCQVYGHTQLDGQHISCRISDGRFLIIIHPEGRTSRPVISIFSYTSRNSCPVSVSVSRMTERWRWVSHSGSNPRRQTSTTQDTKVDFTVWQISQLRSWLCWNIAQHLLYLFQ